MGRETSSGSSDRELPDLGETPDMLETLAHRLKRAHIRARIFGDTPELVRVGRFVLERPLSSGAMGIVYAASDQQLHRSVALKVLRSPAGTAEHPSQLLDEAQAMARLSHPNVATVYEAGIWEGRVYIAMELVRGRTLRKWLSERLRAEQEIVDVFKQAGAGLAAAHAEGLVHRDFKPDNVLVGDDGRVRVVDFGLACEELLSGADGDPASKQAPWPAGTPAYMAPEQYHGGAVDARADVFAFCVTLFEALHQKRPFAGDTADEIMGNVDRGAIVVAPGHRASPWLAEVVRRGLAAKPEERWPSMRELIDKLHHGPPRKRRRWTLWAAASFVLITGSILFALRTKQEVAPASAQPPRPPEAVAALERAKANLHGGGPVFAELRQALALDPSYSEAYLYSLLGPTTYITPQDREWFRKAKAGRAAFSDIEKALLDTLEPVLSRQPSDWAEGAKQAESALQRFPKSGLLWAQLAEYEAHQGMLEEAVAHHRRALAEEPGLVYSVTEPGNLLIQLGRIDEGRAALSKCAYGESTDSRCMAMLMHLLADTGDCGEMEAIARQAMARGLLEGEAQWYLAESLAGQGRSVASVREAASWATSHAPSWLELPVHEIFRFKSAFWAGDFDDAERAAAEVVRWSEGTFQRWFRIASSAFRIWVLLETGRAAEAAEVAQDQLDRLEAWEPSSTHDDSAIAEDFTPFHLQVAYAGGKLAKTDRMARRGAWIVGWEAQVPAPFRHQIWLQGYARNVTSKETAREALDALPSYLPLPEVELKSYSKWGLGVAHLLDGRPADAVPLLEKATRACRGLMAPYDHTRAIAWLGRAYQETGNGRRACTAYKTVLDRWGRNKGKSVTAEQVRTWMRDLPCDAPARRP